MSYVSHTRTELYLLSLLEFDLGDQPVRLGGAIRMTREQLLLVISDDMPFDPGLLPAGQDTTEVSEPFGMKGVRLESFSTRARIYRGTGSPPATLFDLTLHAQAKFPGLQHLTLDGSLVFERGEPRLAAVTLTAERPLTLSDLAESVVGGSWDWADGVADRFAFESGTLYALRAPKNAASDYKYRYTAHGEEVELTPGYGAAATISVFDKPFAISLVVHTPPPKHEEDRKPPSPWIDLKTTSLTPLDFEFFTLRKPSLEICTKKNDSYLRIASEVSILDTPIDISVAATYRDEKFEGSLKVPLGGLDLPVLGGNESQDVTLDVSFEWARQHFRITHLGGIPRLPHDFADQLTAVLNKIPSGTCESIVGGWLNDACSTSISLGMTKGEYPKKKMVMEGARLVPHMIVPLTLTWTADVVGQEFSQDVKIHASFVVPGSLSELPGALCLSVVESAGTIAEDMLSDSSFYVALAAEVAKRIGAKAAARMLCRALEKFAKEIAKKLAELVADAVAETLAEAAALAAALTAVALAGLHDLVDSFLDLLKSIWDWLTGQDDDKKEDAERQLRKQIAEVQKAMQRVRDKVEDARARITVEALEVSVDASGDFVATWSKKPLLAADLGPGLALDFELQLCSGEAGDESGSPWAGQPPVRKGMSEPSYRTPFGSIPDAPHYRLNAKIGASLRGVKFLGEKTDQTLTKAIGDLRGADSDVARSAAGDLQKTLDWLHEIDSSGIQSEVRWATLGMPAHTTVGQSLVGINTRLVAN